MKYLPENTTKRELSFESSNEAVARVDEQGTVYAVANGDAVITVTGHGGIKETVSISVVTSAETMYFDENLYVTGIEQQDGNAFYPVIVPETATPSIAGSSSFSPKASSLPFR